jgi:hypothetical protein
MKTTSVYFIHKLKKEISPLWSILALVLFTSCSKALFNQSAAKSSSTKSETSSTTTNDTNNFITTWKTNNAGTSGANQITIPLFNGATYNFTVDWGDNSESTITAWNDSDLTHTYSSPGTYTVTISFETLPQK